MPYLITKGLDGSAPPTLWPETYIFLSWAASMPHVQVSHGSKIPNILGSPKQTRIHLHSFIQWTFRASSPLRTCMHGFPYHLLPGSLSSPVKPLPYLSWLWSHHHMDNTEKPGCQLGMYHGPLNPHWQQLLIEVAFQKPKKTPHTLFTNGKLRWMRSCPEGTFPLLDYRSDLSLVT